VRQIKFALSLFGLSSARYPDTQEGQAKRAYMTLS